MIKYFRCGKILVDKFPVPLSAFVGFFVELEIFGMENDIRDLIRSKMKSFNYSLGDVKNRINHSALFEKYMKNEANLTIDLAEQIAIVLDFLLPFEPIKITSSPLKFQNVYPNVVHDWVKYERLIGT